MDWWTIEVLDGPGSASAWWQSYEKSLTEAAITNGAADWHVIFDAGWERLRDLPLVRAALDATPDPANGLLVYRGRGGSSGRVRSRGPRPPAGAGSMKLPEPADDQRIDVTSVNGS